MQTGDRELETIPGDTVAVRGLFDSSCGCETFSQRILHFGSGSSAERLDEGSDEVLYVLAGRGQAVLGGEAHDLHPGTALFVGTGTSWSVDGVGELSILSVLIHDPAPGSRSHAALVREIAGMAHSEAEAAPGLAEEKTSGNHLIEPQELKALTLAFEKHFSEPFPVSARGMTAVHRALGFDHTGRVDVAVNPDSAEGIWLREYLDAKAIPYYAFRTAIAGKATAPHIHIGPGSTRLL